MHQWSINVLIKANMSMKLRTIGYRTLRKTSKVKVILTSMNIVWKAVLASRCKKQVDIKTR